MIAWKGWATSPMPRLPSLSQGRCGPRHTRTLNFPPVERYVAELEDNVWHVRGTLPNDPLILGGVPHAKIARSDGRILDVYHTQ